MNLVGYTATALSRNDIEDTPTNKNVVSGAIVELKTIAGALVTIYDDVAGTNPETQKICDTDGQVTFFAEVGNYNLEINGKSQRINLSSGLASFISTKTDESAQDFIDSFALKIFQSPTDGGLTEIQTRTVNANEVYEVRKTSDDSLATIYSDAAGTTEIVQNGTSNVSGSDGVVEFYIDRGVYYITVGSLRSDFTATIKAVALDAAGIGNTVLDIGELLYNTTDKSIHTGDGATQGGIPIANKRNTVLSFDTLSDAVSNASLKNGYTIQLKERETGLGGGGKWDVVLASAVTPNTFDIVQCTGAPTLALVLQTNAGQVVLDKLGCYTASSDAAANQSALEFAMSKYDSLIMVGDYSVHNVKFPNRYLTFRALGRDQCFFIADTSSGDNEYFAAPTNWIDNVGSASERIKTHQVGFNGGTREISFVVHSFFCDFHDLIVRDGVSKGIFQTAKSKNGTLIPTTMVNNRYHNPWVQGTADIGFEIDEDGKSTDWQIFGGYIFNGGSKNFQARTMGGAVLQGVHMYGAPVSADLSKWFEGTIVNSCYFENDVNLGTGLNDNIDFQFGPDNTVRGDLILGFGGIVSAVRSHDNILTNVVHNYFGDRKFYSHGDTYRVEQPFSWTSTNVANTASIRITNALISQESVSGELSPSLGKNTASSLSRDFGFGNGKDYTQVGASTAGGAKSASITVPTVAGSNVALGVNFKLGTRLNHSGAPRVAYKWEGVVYGQGGNTSIYNVAIDEVSAPAEFTAVPTLTGVDNGDGTMTLTFNWEPATGDGYGGWNISISGK